MKDKVKQEDFTSQNVMVRKGFSEEITQLRSEKQVGTNWKIEIGGL